MKKIYILLFLVLTLTSFLQAQDDSKYLKGAVTDTDGKITFNRIIESKSQITDSELFDKVNQWAEKKYNLNDGKTQNRILLSNKEKNQIGCLGEGLLVFGRRLLSADTSPMMYQLIMEIKDGKCDATIRNVRYEYSDGNKNETIRAEDMISDKLALNKTQDKLTNYYGKFRRVTIDSVQVIFNSLEEYINEKGTTSNQVQYIYIDKNTGEEITQPTMQTPKTSIKASLATVSSENVTISATLNGYKSITAKDITDNYISLLNTWNLITSGKDEINTMTASWGGLGTFWNKAVTFCFLNPTRHSISTMDEGETYTISFFGPAYKDVMEFCGSNSGRDIDKIKGSGLTPIKTSLGTTAFSEAWLIIECRKIIALPISEASVKIDKSELDKSWTKNGLHKMYIGEILNVWVK